MEAPAIYGSEIVRPRLTVVRDGGVDGPFSALPHAVIRRTDISRDARFLVSVLLMYGWQGGDITASHATLAADMGCSTRMLRVYLDELIRAGIATEHEAGSRRQKVYRLVSIGTVLPIETANEKPASDSTAVNRKFSTVQSEVSDTFNEKPASDSKKKTPEKKTKEEELPPEVVDGDAAASPATAAPDQAKLLRSLSDGAREILDWHRQCHGRRQPAKLNPESARVLEAAVADLGVDRLKESVRYMAGKIPAVPELSKALRAARTKRSQDESGHAPGTPHRNGAATARPMGKPANVRTY